MGWSIGYDSQWKRDIGYGVPAICDHPSCVTKIDRGLAYVCAQQRPYGGENGCGLFFCYDHATHGKHLCLRCATGMEPFEAKPDVIEWVRWKLTDGSWEQWRQENPQEVATLRQRLESTCDTSASSSPSKM